MKVTRLVDKPIISPEMDARIGQNINGPSLIRVPDWLPHALGRYYLYFAHHAGDHIRLAYADALEGPWRIYTPGVLELTDSLFPTAPLQPDKITNPLWLNIIRKRGPEMLRELHPHIASPDVHVMAASREIRMYYHGLLENGSQMTRVAHASDGLHFTPCEDILGPSYFRVFVYDGWYYAMAASGVLYRCQDGLSPFEKGPELIGPNPRHTAVRLYNGTLEIYWSQIGDTPEHILVSTVDLQDDWHVWRASAPRHVLFSERDWEGANLPLEPSRLGRIYTIVNQVRDPGVFEEHGRTYLLYSIAGEQGIGIAELHA